MGDLDWGMYWDRVHMVRNNDIHIVTMLIQMYLT
jgi:hypothetical protein